MNIRKICLSSTLFLAFFGTSLLQAGNISNIAVLLGDPGDLGTEVTITNTLLQIVENIESHDGFLHDSFDQTLSILGNLSDDALSLALVDSKALIDDLDVPIIVLLKTLLFQLKEIKDLIELLPLI